MRPSGRRASEGEISARFPPQFTLGDGANGIALAGRTKTPHTYQTSILTIAVNPKLQCRHHIPLLMDWCQQQPGIENRLTEAGSGRRSSGRPG